MTGEGHSLDRDVIVGDGGNVTVYERPDGSRYALDKRGQGREWPAGDPVFGRARFDSRPLSTGRWPGANAVGNEPPPQR